MSNLHTGHLNYTAFYLSIITQKTWKHIKIKKRVEGITSPDPLGWLKEKRHKRGVWGDVGGCRLGPPMGLQVVPPPGPEHGGGSRSAAGPPHSPATLPCSGPPGGSDRTPRTLRHHSAALVTAPASDTTRTPPGRAMGHQRGATLRSRGVMSNNDALSGPATPGCVFRTRG